MTKTDVIFRYFKTKPKVVIALFPGLASDPNCWHCDSYIHVGQHGAADYSGVIMESRPATEEEYASLKAELERIGYDLNVVRRQTRKHREAIREQLAHYAGVDE